MDYREVLKELDELREKVMVCVKLERDRLEEKSKQEAYENHKDILYICSRLGRVSIDSMRSQTRLADVNKTRQVYCYLMHKNTRLSVTEIGKIINRNHSTVIASRKVIEQDVDQYYKTGYDPRGTVGLLKAIYEMSGLHY